MTRRIVVTATDAGIGKTVFSAGLAHLFNAKYWKPVQTHVETETDSQVVARLGRLSADHVVPEGLRTFGSPYHAAEIDGVRIDPDLLGVPDAGERQLVIEGAGGLMMPLNRGTVFIDILERWQIPVVLYVPTALSMINQSLLSIEALRKGHLSMLGIAFVGDRNAQTESAICEIGRARWLGRLPWLSPLTPDTLQDTFKASFLPGDFAP
ncbi:dethiobiotin synthase [Bradyrhizobium sp. 1.29L]